MSVVSGQVTFPSPGLKTINFGIPVNDLDVLAGSRSGITEADGMASKGHADAGNQFARPSKDGKAGKDASHCIFIYDTAGGTAVKAAVTGGWGTPTLTFNCVTGNPSYPFDLIART